VARIEATTHRANRGRKPAMSYETIEVEPISPIIGAEIHGVNLAEPLGNQIFQEIHDALMAHQVVFFRDQELTLAQHKAFGKLFGDLHIHPAAPAPDGHPEILVIHADENSKRVAGQGWHSDVSCDEEPPMGSILHLHQVPAPGGDTMFASMYAAYDALSDTMTEFLSGLKARHESRHVHQGRYGHKGKLRDGNDVYPEAVHPIIRTHPVTGRKALYVNSGFTTRIEGLQRKESRALLRFLFEHVKTPEFHCRFHWRNNSIAFWDNRCVQHHALWDYYPQVRHGYRVTIKGDRPV
jgi:taurine dioxygenase